MSDYIFDSHAHYDDEAFDEDRKELLEKIRPLVKLILNCGSSLKACEDTINLSKDYDFIYAAVGVHPENAKEALSNINYIGDLLGKEKVLAVGEIGLDYYYEGYDRDIQIKAFKEQMDLARSLNLPVVVHLRDAYEDALKVLKEFKGVRGVLHCYSGSLEYAREILKLDYYFGFTGVVTFKNSKRPIEVIKSLPLDKILVETDCPYMTPAPNRGKRNDSSYLVHTLTKISEILDIDFEKACRLTYDNACKLFSIKAV